MSAGRYVCAVLARLIAVAVRTLAATWRVERAPWPVEGACVVAFWHGEQLPMIALHRGYNMVGVASLSRDGNLLADTISALGYEVVRGSTSKGGTAVLRACKARLQGGQLPALAVDGPRGPAKHVQGGAEALARIGRVPVVFGVVRAAGFRARSWDKFLVPWPFARVRIEYGVWRGTGTLVEAWSALDSEARSAKSRSDDEHRISADAPRSE